MNATKRKRLEKAGWKEVTVQELLGLTDEEVAFIDMRLSLADCVKNRRQKLGLTQQQVAKRIGSSQARVAKIESADPSVSLDLFFSTLLKLGATCSQIGRVIGKVSTGHAA
ncbi:MAG: helix-turn-helix transcriptional regulator [Planctomycetota bacterium]